MTPRRKKRLRRYSHLLSFNKLSLGPGRRARRSRRLKLYEESAGYAAAAPTTWPGGGLWGWLGRQWAVLGIVLLLAALLYMAFGTSWFYIYDIELVGAERLTKEEIYNRSNLEALSIFWLNPQEVVRRLEEDPAIARAVVSIRLPNKVRIHLQERAPVAVWQSGESSLFVDREGVLFGLRGDASEMLVIHDRREAPVAPGERVDPKVVQSAVDLNALIPERRIFEWEPGVGLSFVTEGEWRVTFGDHTRLRAKIAAFQAFKEKIQPEKKVLLLDLSIPERPYYRITP